MQHLAHGVVADETEREERPWDRTRREVTSALLSFKEDAWKVPDGCSGPQDFILLNFCKRITLRKLEISLPQLCGHGMEQVDQEHLRERMRGHGCRRYRTLGSLGRDRP